MFLSEEERLYRHRLAGTKFQADEKKKLSEIAQSRIEDRRANQKIIEARIERETAKMEAREQAKREKRYQTIEINERVRSK